MWLHTRHPIYCPPALPMHVSESPSLSMPSDTPVFASVGDTQHLDSLSLAVSCTTKENLRAGLFDQFLWEMDDSPSPCLAPPHVQGSLFKRECVW